jgi:hypothetical protein
MSATAWAIYNKAKKKIGNGTVKLGVDTFKIHLHTSASNAATLTLSLESQVTNESSGGTYAAKTLGTVIWTAGASAGQYKFSSANPVWTATGGSISNIKFAVIRNSLSATGGHVLCYSQLTTAQFSLSSTNTLTIQMNASGIFTLA